MALRARHETIAARLSDFFALSQADCSNAVKKQFSVVNALLDGTGQPCLMAVMEVCLNCVSSCRF